MSDSLVSKYIPYSAYKDSGIEWLGAIPQHWEVKKIKWIVSKIGSGKTPKGGAQVDQKSGIIFIRSQNVYFDGLRLNDVAYRNSSIDAEMSSTRVLPRDILLNIRGASLGRCTITSDNFTGGN